MGYLQPGYEKFCRSLRESIQGSFPGLTCPEPKSKLSDHLGLFIRVGGQGTAHYSQRLGYERGMKAVRVSIHDLIIWRVALIY